MIRRPPRSTQSRSSAASDVYKRQLADSRHDDDGDVLGRQGGAKSLEDRQAGDVREAEIQQNKAGLFLDSHVNAFPASACGDGYIARSSQHVSIQMQALDVVIDYQ